MFRASKEGDVLPFNTLTPDQIIIVRTPEDGITYASFITTCLLNVDLRPVVRAVRTENHYVLIGDPEAATVDTRVGLKPQAQGSLSIGGRLVLAAFERDAQPFDLGEVEFLLVDQYPESQLGLTQAEA